MNLSSSCLNVLLPLLLWFLGLLGQIATETELDRGSKGKLDGLRCPPCSIISCKPRRFSRVHKRLNCLGSVTKDICGCCPVCAKVENQECGGKWEHLGVCDANLVCVKPPNLSLRLEYYNPAPGICTALPGIENGPTLHDGTWPRDPAPEQQGVTKCEPKCEPEFCRENPKAVCSAVDNFANQKKDCHGECQHTACRACRFAEEEPQCIKCDKDDFECLKAFGRCVRQHICTRSKMKLPCSTEGSQDGKFECLVPECLKK